MKLLCKLFGHRHDGVIHPIRSRAGKWSDASGPIVYHAYLCKRCGKRIPVTPEDAVEKEAKRVEIAAVMNESRSHYGLPPLRWDD